MIRVIMNVLLILGVGYVITQVVNFYLSINSGAGQTRNDIAELKSKLATYIASLIPLDLKELELLSVNAQKNTERQGISTLKYGAFLSIYQEPLLAYGHKSYKYPTDKSLTIVCTDDDDYIYLTKGDRTQVFLNEDELGTIDASGNMYAPRTENIVAHIQVDDVSSSHPVHINGREVGEVVNLNNNESPNPRAYQFIEPMDHREAHMFKALTFLSLVEENL